MNAKTEQNSTHTPGPWIFYADLPSTEPNWHIVTTSNKMRVLANVHIEPGNAMDVANARLIAAAPDMLMALTRIAAQARELASDRMTLNAGLWAGCAEDAERAIAKAVQS